MSSENKLMPDARPKNCPVCRKPMTEKFRPFCSARCADIDLGCWFNENYTVPVEDEEIPEDAAAGS